MIEEWGHIIPVDPTYVPSPAAQFRALQFWASRDRQGSSKTIEIHAQVQYIPPTDGTLHAVCCPNCRRAVDPYWLEDAVNLARRFCGHARSGEILVGEATRRQASDEVDCHFVGEIEFKGFSSAKPVYRIEWQ